MHLFSTCLFYWNSVWSESSGNKSKKNLTCNSRPSSCAPLDCLQLLVFNSLWKRVVGLYSTDQTKSRCTRWLLIINALWSLKTSKSCSIAARDPAAVTSGDQVSWCLRSGCTRSCLDMLKNRRTWNQMFLILMVLFSEVFGHTSIIYFFDPL